MSVFLPDAWYLKTRSCTFRISKFSSAALRVRAYKSVHFEIEIQILVSLFFIKKMKINTFIHLVLYLLLLSFLISAIPTNRKNRSETPIHRGSVKPIIDKSQICSVFATKITSKSNLHIIKNRFPAFFTQCKLVIPVSIKQQSMTKTCKRFNWKSRSLCC